MVSCNVHDVESVVGIRPRRPNLYGGGCFICCSGDSTAEIGAVFEVYCIDCQPDSWYIIELSFEEEIMGGFKLGKLESTIGAKEE